MAPLALLFCMTQVCRVITSIGGTFMEDAAMTRIRFVGSRMLLGLKVAVFQLMEDQLLKLPQQKRQQAAPYTQ